MNDELKPCPFCEAEYPLEMTPNVNVLCTDCGAKMPLEIWNTRPIEDAMQARIDELEGEVSKWKDTASALSSFWGEAEADAERIYKEYLEYRTQKSSVCWEDAAENSPAIISHELRMKRKEQ